MSSRAERVLSVLLVAFLLVGGLWLYAELDGVFAPPVFERYAKEQGIPALNTRVQQLRQALSKTEAALAEADKTVAGAQREYEFRREEYRTAMEAGRATAQQKRSFESARARHEEARSRRQTAAAQVKAAQDALRSPDAELRSRYQTATNRYDDARLRHEALVAGVRLAYLLVVFFAALMLWRRLWLRQSRYQGLGIALLVFGGIQMAVMAGDYAWHHLSSYAPLLISVAGVGGTVAAVVALRRFVLAPARLARFRLRHNDCPFCGHTLEHAGGYCAECGRLVQQLCPHCGATHFAYSVFCPVTGQPLGKSR